MKCKFCQGDLDSGVSICPHCGKDNLQEEVQKPAGMDKTKLVLAICAIVAVALLGIGLIMVTLFGVKGGWESLGSQETTPGATTAGPETTPGPTEYVPGEGVLQFRSYSAEDSKAIADSAVVVATAGGQNLTNRQLQMYFWLEFYDVWNYAYSLYGSYAPYYIGLDYNTPFEDQPMGDGSMNWQQYILDISTKTWHRYQVLGLLAKDAGYELTPELRQDLEDTKANLDATAQQNGMADANALLAAEMGPGVTIEDYVEYLELYYLGQVYFLDIFSEVEVTDADLEAYFTENQEALGVTKESGNITDVRHILIMPEGGTQGEDGYMVYTEDEWAACLAQAQQILDEWKAGEATEDSFIELTGKYTQDTGYASNGGLYTSVMKNSGYVSAFENWAADTQRQAGDCELVQTEYGYHIMYAVDTELAWVRLAREGFKTDACSKLIDEATERYPMEVFYDKISLGIVSFG